MSLIKKVRAVEKIYQALEKETVRFQQKSNFKCIENCHVCCIKNNIEASPLEFLPLAYHLYKTQQAYTFLENLEQHSIDSICALFNPFNPEGACTQYMYRGLICRLFGFSAMNDKNEFKNLVTCKVLKAQRATDYKNAQGLINQGLAVPLTNKYYMKLYSVDFKLASQNYPVNKAIQQAIEAVLFYFSFSDKKAG